LSCRQDATRSAESVTAPRVTDGRLLQSQQRKRSA
jgi:hypothetical protein